MASRTQVWGGTRRRPCFLVECHYPTLLVREFFKSCNCGCGKINTNLASIQLVYNFNYNEEEVREGETTRKSCLSCQIIPPASLIKVS